MSEERLLILKMLEEGKINAQEAAALLDAMGDTTKSADKDQESGRRRLEKQGEDFAQKVEQAADRFSKSLEAKLEGGIAEKLSHLPRILAKLPFVTNHESHEFTQEFSGTFTPDLATLPVKLTTVNGHIVTESWDQNHYKLVVTQKIRAKDRELARNKLVQIPLSESAEDMDALVVETLHHSDVSLTYHVYLPSDRSYDLRLMTNNGRVEAAKLTTKIVKIMTTNGSIRVRHLSATEVDVSASNGSCKLDGVDAKVIRQRTGNGSLSLVGSAESIDCVSTNGSIKVTPVSFLYDRSSISVRTTNGSIRCTFPSAEDLAVAVDAVTAVGKVQVSLPNFSYALDDKRTGTHHIKGGVDGVAEENAPICLHARTSSGSIIIAQEEGTSDA